ncbi:MAG: rod shape-determining protein MreC [Deltaproteobacteria bacterium]|nr:rod shape-determining protein MreC [Deltaproteobacteria bacterium]
MPLNFFAFDIRKLLIVIAVIALPILSINMKRNPGEEPWYRRPFTWFVAASQGGYSSFTSGVRGTTSMYLNLVGIKKDNQQLLRENQELRAQLAASSELKLENERLNQLLEFKLNTKMELLAAKVIARDLSPDHESIRINRGYRQGLRKLMGVITVEGVVGYVLSTEMDTAQILVITDRSAAVDALVQRTRARGLISGKDAAAIRLRYLERADDVAVSDAVVTSGLKGTFPKGFPIGKVTSVRKTDFGISQEAVVEPVVSPSNLEEVFVVLDSGGEDFNEKLQSGFGPPLLSKMNLPGSAPASTVKISQ